MAGGYEAERDQAGLDYIQTDIDTFAAAYSPAKVTMFFFPGGMGSQLFRDEIASPSPSHDFDLTWFDEEIFGGASAELAVQPDGRDLNSRFVVASGFIDFPCLRPYEHLQAWCISNDIQLFTFGYDWRRSSGAAADLFLDGFLPRLDAAIGVAKGTGQARGNLQNYAFVGHSLGGMVVKLALNRGTADFYVSGMNCAVTVASPFYGYGGQVHRYLIGDPKLSWTFYDWLHNNYKMARLIGTMPGGYEFVYMSLATYQANAAAFAADPVYQLQVYPCLATDGTPADPYNPQDQGDRVYYPLFDADNNTMLANAIPVADAVAAPLEAGIAARFYNIRGVQTAQNGTPLDDTPVSSTWARVSKLNFNPDTYNADPITDQLGAGDGTQPAWTTRLLQLFDFPGHVITVTGDPDWLEHMQMMSNAGVQTALANILAVQEVFPLAPWTPPPRATRPEFDAFLRNMPKTKEIVPKSYRRWEALEYIFSFSPGERRKLMWRGYTDLLRRPPSP